MRKLLMGALVLAGFAQPAHAEAGDVLVRLRGIMVAPNEDSGSVLPAFPGEEVSVDNNVMPEVDVTYMATDHIGFELIAATTKHTASGVSGTTGDVGKLASAWVLPPTLTLQYHPVANGPVRPYVGAGVNYTLFFDQQTSGPLAGAELDLGNSWGLAAHAGVDFRLADNRAIRLDVRWMDIDTDVSVNGADVGTVKIDPLVYGVAYVWNF